MGQTSYYRQFVRSYGVIAKPLTNLAKKDAFQWSPQAQEAFEKLRTAMTTIPVLAVPEFAKVFVLEADASSKGIRVVLSQDQCPIAFLSQALSPRNQARSVYKRELLTIALPVQKWRHYLLGHHFIIPTDQ